LENEPQKGTKGTEKSEKPFVLCVPFCGEIYVAI
jgi:hypothetical protein